MPQLTISLEPKTWTLLTEEAVTGNIRVQNMSTQISVFMQATETNEEPNTETAMQGALRMQPEGLFAAPQTIATLYPGVVSPAYLWVWCAASAQVSASYA